MFEEIFRSYEQYKHADSGKQGPAKKRFAKKSSINVSKINLQQKGSQQKPDFSFTPQAKKPVKPEQPAGFWTRIKGSFFMFSGYLGNPTVTVGTPSNRKEVLPTSRDENGNDTSNYFGNHFGIYDYLTLGIPYFLEWLLRGNWLPFRSGQNICQALFTIIPVVPALATIRNGFGLIATLLSSPIVAGIYMAESYLFTMDLQKFDREQAESDHDLAIKGFNTRYKQLKELFKTDKTKVLNSEEHVKKARALLNDRLVLVDEQPHTIVGLHTQANDIPEAVTKNEGLFFRSKTKIGNRLDNIKEKYSFEAFKKTFSS